MKKTDAKEQILAAGMGLIALHGFNATGIDAILKRAGIPKGSFYHYFGTKENFGMEILEKFSSEYDKKLDSFLLDKTRSPLRRIYDFLEHSIENLIENNYARGCLAGNLGQELADQNERLRLRLAELFHAWQVKFAACLREAQEQGEIDAALDADDVAHFLLSGWEGAILRAKVMRSAAPLENFISMLSGCVFRRKA